MGDIRLSFCITTRNRAGFLDATLSSLLAQATEEVEVVVLDAASTDGTGEVVGRHAGRFPRLRYRRQEENRGVDRDYDGTVELAGGEYCWMMSDDDVLAPGAVGEVLGHLGKGFDLLVVNAEDRDFDLKTVLGERRLPFVEDREYAPSDAERLFADVAHHLSFIPGVVVRRSLWLSRDRSRHFGSLFNHVGVIFQAPLPGGALVVARPLVSVRNANASWAARSFEIWMFKWPELIWSLPAFPDGLKERVSPREPWRSVKSLLIHRAMGSYSLEEYGRWIAPRKAPPARKAVSWMAAAAPGPLVNAALLLYCSVVGKTNRIPRYNLSNSRFNILRRPKRNPG